MIHGDWIGRWGRARPEALALVDAITGRRYTYARLADEVEALARFLLELEVVKGDRVAVLSFNRVEYLSLFFAAARLGAILVPLNFRLAESEFDYYLEDAGPSVFFCDADHLALAARLESRGLVRRIVCFDDDARAAAWPRIRPDLSDDPLPEIEIEADDPALIIYTSGTTGLPKGVILSHGLIFWNSVNTNLGWDLRSTDKTILHSSLFYTAGWNVFTLPLFQTAAVNVLVRGFEPDLILELIQAEKITLFFGVPTMFQMMMESPRFAAADFSSIRFLVSGGAPLPAAVRDRFLEAKNIRIWEGYGLTEVGPNNFMANGKPGTIGRPMPCVDVRLIGADGRVLGPGEEGEILLRGPNMCSGYWRQPEATAEAIQDGWFHTGDLGRLDQDGDLAIVGRKKDMIISGGINIYPAEIERAVEAHPVVAGAAVIGVSDDKWGEVGKAIVELKPGQSLDQKELEAFLAGRLGRFKLPKYLAIVEALPRTPASGKVQKFLLKKDHGRPDNH
ncbi:MAG: long-chain fatty acid--CoA ligase [Thermodesulfobacteriota bacterium]